MEFEPKISELVQTGATAALILDAVRQLSAECIEGVLQRIDGLVANGMFTQDVALIALAEIAAYRRIVQRIEHKIRTGTAARRRFEETASNG